MYIETKNAFTTSYQLTKFYSCIDGTCKSINFILLASLKLSNANI